MTILIFSNSFFQIKLKIVYINWKVNLLVGSGKLLDSEKYKSKVFVIEMYDMMDSILVFRKKVTKKDCTILGLCLYGLTDLF